jgi:DNA-binding NarL/FixJ family response regulator
MNELIRTFVIEADNSFRQVINTLLEEAVGIVIVGGAGNVTEALFLVGELEPDIILLDMEVLDWDKPSLLAQIQALSPGSKLIILSSPDEEHLVLDAFKQGAQGHLIKRQSQPSEIIEAIHVVNRGQAFLTPHIAGRVLDEMARQRRHGMKDSILDEG